ncbi:MAG: bifunctional oligoribonuclease/PAP phosphatase NrnA [Thermodesulfobacteriota bacterium]
MSQPQPELVAALSAARRILVATHVFPDGDALGSQLAVGLALESLGKEVLLYSADGAPHLLDFLPATEKLATSLPGPDDNYDCVLVLDCGDSSRLGEAEEAILALAPVLAIDHHNNHKFFTELAWVDDKRSSTGEMVYDLCRLLGVELSYEMAYCLYTAILTDTGSFKYESTSAHTLRVAADLLDLGVRPDEVCGHIFDNYSSNRLRLLQEVLATLTLHGRETIAFIRVTQAALARTGAKTGDTEMFIDFPRSLSSVKVAVFLKEVDNDLVGVSMRAKGEVDVAAVARSFGGGGHVNAAGFKRPDVSLDRLQEEILQQLLPLV